MLVRRIDAELPVPQYAHPGDAGIDLYSAEDVTIAAGERVVVRSGVALAIPEGYAGLVVPRSGLASSSGLSMVNTPGVVDSGYRGEVRVVLINHDREEPIEISRGDRIAQLLVVPVARADVIEVDSLPPSERGSGGFGSTGR